MFSERKELPTSEEVIGGKVDKESSIIKDTKNQKPKSEYKYNDKKNKGKGNPEKFNMTKINKNEGFNTLAEELKRKGFYTE